MLYFHIMIANRKFILFYFLTVPASITNGGATNVKGIRIQCSSKRSKKSNKGRKLISQYHEIYFEIDRRNFCALHCVTHLIKCARNNIYCKGNILCSSKLELSNRLALEERCFDINILKQLHQKAERINSIHSFNINSL